MWDATEAINEQMGRDPQAQDYAWRAAWVAFTRADFANRQGRFADAERYCNESRRIYREAGHETLPWILLSILSEAQQGLGQLDEARETLLQAIEHSLWWTGHEHLPMKADSLMRVSVIETKIGDYEGAFVHLTASLKIARELADYNLISDDLGLAALIAAGRKQTIRAARLSGAAAAVWVKQKRMPWPHAALDALLPGWRDGADEPALSAAYAAGQAMTADEAAAYALGDG